MDPSHDPSRQAAESRRERLRVLMDRLQEMLAVPQSGELEAWRDHVRELGDELLLALDDHIRETDGATGFLAEIVEHAPRLSGQVEVLREEHPRLYDDAQVLRDAVEGELNEELVESTRASVRTMLTDLERHYEQGAQLLYESYWVDVATGD